MSLAHERLTAAWSRMIGVDLTRPGLQLIDRADLDAVVVIEIGSACVAVFPSFVGDDLRGVTVEEARSIERVANRLRVPAARVIGTADLWASVEVRAPRGGVEVRPAQTGDLATLRSRCSLDEWEESGLDGMPSVWIALDETGVVVSAAGYELWADTVAQLGVLTDPGARGRGFAASAVGAAMADALRHADVVQWRSREGNTASRRLAQSLGFDLVGRQSAIAVRSPQGSDTPDA